MEILKYAIFTHSFSRVSKFVGARLSLLVWQFCWVFKNLYCFHFPWSIKCHEKYKIKRTKSNENLAWYSTRIRINNCGYYSLHTWNWSLCALVQMWNLTHFFSELIFVSGSQFFFHSNGFTHLLHIVNLTDHVPQTSWEWRVNAYFLDPPRALFLLLPLLLFWMAKVNTHFGWPLPPHLWRISLCFIFESPMALTFNNHNLWRHWSSIARKPWLDIHLFSIDFPSFLFPILYIYYFDSWTIW